MLIHVYIHMYVLIFTISIPLHVLRLLTFISHLHPLQVPPRPQATVVMTDSQSFHLSQSCGHYVEVILPVHVRVHVCACACWHTIYMYMYILMYVYMYTHMYMYVPMYSTHYIQCIHIYTCTCTCTWT